MQLQNTFKINQMHVNISVFPNDANAEETQNSGNSFLGEGLPHLEVSN